MRELCVKSCQEKNQVRDARRNKGWVAIYRENVEEREACRKSRCRGRREAY